MKFVVNVDRLPKGGALYWETLSSVAMLNNVVNDPAFAINLKAELSKEDYKLPNAELSPWREKDWQDVYNHIMGSCKIVLKFGTYWRPSSALAKVVDGVIIFNRRWFFRIRDEEREALILHEVGHIEWGFDHTFWDNPNRRYSLNYLLNRVYERTHRQIFPGVPVTYKPQKTVWDYILPWRWF